MAQIKRRSLEPNKGLKNGSQVNGEYASLVDTGEVPPTVYSKSLKTIKMEDDQIGRRQKWKTTKMEDDQNGRRPK